VNVAPVPGPAAMGGERNAHFLGRKRTAMEAKAVAIRFGVNPWAKMRVRLSWA